ncbi:class I mannose-6-phosphate isomerase [Sporolactobacillus nakayamae]|uniref:Mannose-6-phosphate isomerase n=1 Tax=Sporolactobacillus nakayamae TaxID=269670 RepID=A0A1I2UU82_9BACL|nr:class I mannose-6-phosphate isomerase [Sporolactobacillus nakayamae]SFG79769.1 mannose-6-phosphate isomerase [Sporolactobacillus nakayamae]
MLLLEPISKRRIWGTKRLHQFSGDKKIDRIGSVYSVSATDEISNNIKNGRFIGRDLNSVIKEQPNLFGLRNGETYPIIVSMTAADEALSIQVHPPDEYANRVESQLYGKSESWYFIEAPIDGWLYAGSKINDKNKIKEKMKEGKYNDVVDRCKIQLHDLLFIPSGTLHALTKGALVYEIQQSTDITYRFFDYNRIDQDGEKRELHLEKAIEALQPYNRVKRTEFSLDNTQTEYPYDIKRTIIKGNYQNTERISQSITVIKGQLTINDENVNQGCSLLVMPNESVVIQNQAEVVIATPNLYWR